MYASINTKTGDIELAIMNNHTEDEEIITTVNLHDITDQPVEDGNTLRWSEMPEDLMREHVETVLDCKASDMGYTLREFYWF
jgi:hypothetical protein